MQNEYEILSSLTTPLGLVSDLGMTISTSVQGAHFVSIPHEGEIWVTDHGFLALDENSSFISGGCIDLLALLQAYKLGLRRLDAYRAAVEVLMTLHGSKIPLQKGDVTFLERGAVEAFNRRRIFNAVMIPERKGNAASVDKVGLESKLATSGIDLNVSRRVAVVMEAGDWARLRERCEDAGISLDLPDKARIVYPHFKDFSTLSSLYVQGTRPQFDRVITLYPSRMAFSGLLSTYPEDEVYMSSDSSLAGTVMFSFRDKCKPATCLGVITDNTSANIGWKPVSAKYITRVDDTDFRKPAVLAREGIQIKVLQSQTSGDIYGGMHEDWDSFIVDRILEELIEKRQISSKAKLLLESCKLSPENKHLMALRLRQEGLFAVADVINQMFHDGILLENNQVRLLVTDTGYKFQKQFALDAPPEELTNFTMELLANANFPEDANVYHRAKITLRGQTFDTVIKHDDLETSRKLDRAVKVAEMAANAGKQDNRVTPVISELNIARFLIPYFREVTSKLPSEDGVSALGWNGMRSIFHGPGFCVSKKDGETMIDHKTRVKHPGILVLNNYDFTTSSNAMVSAEIPHELADVISQMCAVIGRTYHGYHVKPIAIRNSPVAMQTMKRLFRGIGQTSPLEMNSNQRMASDIPGIKGYPVLATGYNRQQMRVSRLPLFMMADYGASIEGPYTEEQLVAAENSMRMLMQKVSYHLLNTDGAHFKRVNSLSYENELVREGADLVCRASSLNAWPISVTPYEAVEKVLRSIPVNEVRKYFAHDLSDQVVYFYYGTTPVKSSKQDLILELSPLVTTLKDGGKHLVLDAASALDILQNFYHEQVQLEPVNLPAFAAAQ